MEKKKKNLGAPRIKSLPFMGVWVVGHIIVWVALYTISEMDGFHRWEQWLTFIAFGLIMGLGLSFMQKALIQYTYHDSLKFWMRVTVVGWILGWGAFWGMEDFVNWFDNYPLGVMLLPLFVIPAALQWFILRENTRQAWLWIAAGAASAMAFGALYGPMSGENVFKFVMGATAQGAVTGLSLLWLYGQSRTAKIKSGNPV